MKKILIILLFLLFLCGCTANYKIEIKDNKIYENLTIIETNKGLFDKETDSGWTMRDSFKALVAEDEFSYRDYDIKLLESLEQLGIEYSRGKIDSIENSSIINQCYLNPKVTVDGNIVTINTGDEFDCYELYESLENIKVTFKTNHKVISTNCDSKESGSYVWNITKNGNKKIEISYDKSITKINYTVYAIISLAFIVILVISYFIIKKLKKRNSF